MSSSIVGLKVINNWWRQNYLTLLTVLQFCHCETATRLLSVCDQLADLINNSENLRLLITSNYQLASQIEQFPCRTVYPFEYKLITRVHGLNGLIDEYSNNLENYNDAALQISALLNQIGGHNLLKNEIEMYVLVLVNEVKVKVSNLIGAITLTNPTGDIISEFHLLGPGFSADLFNLDLDDSFLSSTTGVFAEGTKIRYKLTPSSHYKIILYPDAEITNQIKINVDVNKLVRYTLFKLSPTQSIPT